MESRVIYWVSQKRSCSHIAQLHGALPSKKRFPCRIKGNRNNKKFPWEVTSRVGQRIENRFLSSSAGQSIKPIMIQHLYILSSIPRIESSSGCYDIYITPRSRFLCEKLIVAQLIGELSALYGTPIVQYYVHKSPQLDLVLKQINVVRIFMIYVHFNIILYLCLWLTSGLFASQEIECCDIVTSVVIFLI